MRYFSVCSGIEAATVAWEYLGWEPLAFSEIDRFPSRLLEYRYPNVPNLGDMTKIDWEAWCGKVDVLVGGTPCQAFSVAGARRSLADERGNLTLEFVRAANIIRPRFVVWENVPGVLSTKDNAFGCFLGGLVGAKQPLQPTSKRGRWPSAGMVVGPERSAAWRILDAQYFGLAQRRKRVFVVACPRDGVDPFQVLFEPDGLQRYSPPCREAGEGVAHDVIGSLTSSGRGVERPRESRGQDPVIPVLYNAEGSDGATLTKSNIGKHVNNQTPLVIGVDEEQNAAEGLMGTLKARREGGGQEAFIAHALRAEGHDASEDGSGRGVPLVSVGFQETGQGYWMQHDVACGLRDMSTGSGAAVANVIAQPIAFTQNQSGDLLTGEICAAISTNQNATGRNTAKVITDMAVRRLTPLECERLQGFPDDYTAIPGAADAPRYKALGNSMAVPVMRWVGQNIQNHS